MSAYRTFAFKEEGTLLCPYPRCSACDALIEDASMALVAWDNYEDPTLIFAHKGDCDADLGYPGPWRQLDEFLVQLCVNANVAHASVKRRLGP